MSIGLFFQIWFGLLALYFFYDVSRALWTGTMFLGRDLSAKGDDRAEFWFALAGQVLFLLLMLSCAWGFSDIGGTRMSDVGPYLMLLTALGAGLAVAARFHGSGQVALDCNEAPVRSWFEAGINALLLGISLASFAILFLGS